MRDLDNAAIDCFNGQGIAVWKSLYAAHDGAKKRPFLRINILPNDVAGFGVHFHRPRMERLGGIVHAVGEEGDIAVG